SSHTATPEIYTLSLHDALPISAGGSVSAAGSNRRLAVSVVRSRTRERGHFPCTPLLITDPGAAGWPVTPLLPSPSCWPHRVFPSPAPTPPRTTPTTTWRPRGSSGTPTARRGASPPTPRFRPSSRGVARS